MLETDRLLLRPWREDDADALFELARDPKVGPAAGWPSHRSVQESTEIIRSVLMMPDSFAIVERTTGALVGAIALKHEDISEMAGPGEAELGYWIDAGRWGLGYATEAARAVVAYGFNELGLTSIWAGYYEGNERSRRVQEKLGFVFQYRVEREVELLGERRVECCQRLLPRQDGAGYKLVGCSRADSLRSPLKPRLRPGDALH